MGTIHDRRENETHIDYLYESVLDKSFIEILNYKLAIFEIHNDEEAIIKDKKASLQKPKNAPTKPVNQKQEAFARINYQLLDKLIELSGELILCRNQFTRKLDRGLQQDFHALSTLINDMQDGLMMTRMQPFSVVSSKFPRMVRDTARKLNKKVQFNVEGDWIEMDRTILEGAKAIFTHILRNSLDHGIEAPNQRINAGKASEGQLNITVSQNTGFVQFIVADDGSGIDPEKIKAKALANGVITTAQAEVLPDEKALMLIYTPGFSTSGSVSDISGRGVGMDVVKTEVEKLGGSISLNSELGHGTSITIKLPQSMAILNSLVIKSNHQSYAIPRNNISEVLKIQSDELSCFQEVEGSTLLKHRGRLLPLLDLTVMINESLNKDLNQHAKKISFNEGPITVIVIKQMDKAYGLIVEEVLFQEEVVIKPLNEFLESFSIFTGMTILSTGKVCFILDVQSLAECGRVTYSDVVSISEAKSSAHTTDTYFIFENYTNEQFAIPISQVAMIHQLGVDQLANCGSEHFVNIHDEEFKVINLADFIDSQKVDLFSDERVYLICLKGLSSNWVIACKTLIGTKCSASAEIGQLVIFC